MKIRDMIRRFLGIEDLLAESAKWNQELSNHRCDLETIGDRVAALGRIITQENAQLSALRKQIEDSKIQPASAAFIDAIFKQTRDRIDLVMTVLDGFREGMARR